MRAVSARTRSFSPPTRSKWSRCRESSISSSIRFVRHDLNPYVATLAIDGALVLVGYLGDLEPPLDTIPLIFGRRSVAGSLIGGMAETQALFDFCGAHGVVSDVEMIRMNDINEAYERLLKSDVKYRFVIDMESLKA